MERPRVVSAERFTLLDENHAFSGVMRREGKGEQAVLKTPSDEYPIEVSHV